MERLIRLEDLTNEELVQFNARMMYDRGIRSDADIMNAIASYLMPLVERGEVSREAAVSSAVALDNAIHDLIEKKGR